MSFVPMPVLALLLWESASKEINLVVEEEPACFGETYLHNCSQILGLSNFRGMELLVSINTLLIAEAEMKWYIN